jgi:hypothetical protein
MSNQEEPEVMKITAGASFNGDLSVSNVANAMAQSRLKEVKLQLEDAKVLCAERTQARREVEAALRAAENEEDERAMDEVRLAAQQHPDLLRLQQATGATLKGDVNCSGYDTKDKIMAGPHQVWKLTAALQPAVPDRLPSAPMLNNNAVGLVWYAATATPKNILELQKELEEAEAAEKAAGERYATLRRLRASSHEWAAEIEAEITKELMGSSPGAMKLLESAAKVELSSVVIFNREMKQLDG